jgi:hypothetical protein
MAVSRQRSLAVQEKQKMSGARTARRSSQHEANAARNIACYTSLKNARHTSRDKYAQARDMHATRIRSEAKQQIVRVRSNAQHH